MKHSVSPQVSIGHGGNVRPQGKRLATGEQNSCPACLPQQSWNPLVLAHPTHRVRHCSDKTLGLRASVKCETNKLESRSWVSKATMPPNMGHTNGLLPKKGHAAQANRLLKQTDWNAYVTWLRPVHSPRQQRFHHHVTPYTLGSKGELPPPLGVLQTMFAAFPGVSSGEPVA